MTADERRASAGLAGIFALRMLGLFLILPVFSVYAKTLPGGDNLAHTRSRSRSIVMTSLAHAHVR